VTGGKKDQEEELEVMQEKELDATEEVSPVSEFDHDVFRRHQLLIVKAASKAVDTLTQLRVTDVLLRLQQLVNMRQQQQQQQQHHHRPQPKVRLKLTLIASH
jgi:hypothetical protein